MPNNYLYVPKPEGLLGDHVLFDDRTAEGRRAAWAQAQRLMASRQNMVPRCVIWRRTAEPIPADLPVVGECLELPEPEHGICDHCGDPNRECERCGMLTCRRVCPRCDAEAVAS